MVSDTTLSTAKQTLYEASRLILNDRNQQYGTPCHSFQLIADFWTVYLHGRGVLYAGCQITPLDVAMLMDLLKTSRAVTSDFKSADSFIDKAGYAGLAAGLAAEAAPATEEDT